MTLVHSIRRSLVFSLPPGGGVFEKAPASPSHPEIGGGDCLARQIFRRAGQRHPPLLQTIDTRGGGERLHDAPLCLISAISAISAWHSCSVSPPATSSSNSTAGSEAKARANSSRLRSRKLSVPAGRLALPARPQRVRIAMQLS